MARVPTDISETSFNTKPVNPYDPGKIISWPEMPPQGRHGDNMREWVDDLTQRSGISKGVIASVLGFNSAPNFYNYLNGSYTASKEKEYDMWKRWNAFKHLCCILPVGFTATKNKAIQSIMDLYDYFITGNAMEEDHLTAQWNRTNAEKPDPGSKGLFTWADHFHIDEIEWCQRFWDLGIDVDTIPTQVYLDAIEMNVGPDDLFDKLVASAVPKEEVG